MKNQYKFRREWQKQKWGYFFILPQMLLFFLFMVYPVFEGFRLSLLKVDFFTQSWVGLKNYVDLLTDPVFKKAIVNTMVFVISGTVLTIVFSLFVSTAIFDKGKRYINFVRSSFYLPVFISMVVICIIWNWLLNPSIGLVNYLIQSAGFESINFMSSAIFAKPILIILICLANIGQAVVLFIATLNGISPEIIEASEIDGANRRQRISRILLPLCRDNIIYISLLTVISIMKVYIVIAMLTGGGPNYATTTLMYQMYEEAFTNGNIGSASAMGVVMFVLVLLISIPQIAGVLRREK